MPGDTGLKFENAPQQEYPAIEVYKKGKSIEFYIFKNFNVQAAAALVSGRDQTIHYFLDLITYDI